MKLLLLLVAMLATASVANAEANREVLMADFSNGTVVIRDSICTLNELVDDFPYEGYVIVNKKLVSRGCWKRDNNSESRMIVFIEREGKDRYLYNKIEAKYFK